MPSPKPTILVKKSDGTSVRMGWDEFQRYRTQNTVNKTQTTSDINHKSEIINPKSELPAKIGEEALATTAPVKEIFVDEAKYARTAIDKTHNTINKTHRTDDRMQSRDNRKSAFVKASADAKALADKSAGKQVVGEVKPWTEDDSQSLLEEKTGVVVENKATSVLPNKRDDLYSLFIKEIRFPIKDELRGRLQSLIVSFVKGIRTEEQVKGYLKRSEADGGLGFSDAQVEAVAAAIKKIWRAAVNLEPEKNKRQISKEEVNRASAMAVRPEIKLRVSPNLEKINAKTMMQDVTPPKVEKAEIKKMSVGPVDEIATMSLTNFRQLAPTASQAAQILQEKFFTLKKESIVLYLQAVEVWRSSPLYKDYQDLIKRAVSERRKLSEVVDENKMMKWEEFLEIAEVGREI